MKNTEERDRFDELPDGIDRRGSHRAPLVRRRVVTFAWAALVTGLLVGAGTIGLFAMNGKLDVVGFLLPGLKPTPSAIPTAAPTVDAKMTVNVLNGTATEGLASQVGEKLAAAGITVGTKSNSSETTVKHTMVFYSQKSSEGAARGVCKALASTCSIKFTSAYAASSAPLTLVMGKDYKVVSTN
ncbi:MAG: hypothetical protein RLZZ600_1317 [Actinomycetota bacterium]|jgi:hypothetical protein